MITGIWMAQRQFIDKKENPKKRWNRPNKSTLVKLRPALFGCLAVILLNLSPAYSAGTITEDFTDSQVDEEFWDLYTWEEGTTVQVANDRLEISVAGEGYAGLSSIFTLEGDFEMQVDFTLTNWPTDNGTQLSIDIYDQSGEGNFSVARANSTWDEQYFIYSIDYVPNNTGVTGPTLSGTLRMVRTGETMEGFYWNGSGWQSIGSSTNEMFGGRVGVSLSAGPYGSVYSGVPAQVAFDNIQVDYTSYSSGFGAEPEHVNDALFDFGAGKGVYVRYNNTTWTKIHSLSPEIITTGDFDGDGRDESVMDFGPGIGTYVFYDNSSWMKVHSLSPEIIETGDLDGNGKDECIVDFGPGIGIWVFYNAETWVKLHSLSPEIIETGDLDGNGKDECVIDFGAGIGTYVFYNNTTWTKLHSLSPEIIAIGDGEGNGLDDCLMDFGPGVGLWVWYNNVGWAKFHSLSPEIIAGGDLDGDGGTDAVIDFGTGVGIWVMYSSETWVKLHSLSPELITTADLDKSGQDDVIIDFGSGIGTYIYYNNSTWTKLHSLSPEIIATGNLDEN